MSEPINDGGPAFPLSDGNCGMNGGMSLRDYFAAKWLHGASSFWANTAPETLAKHAYEMADAMLKARSES